MALSLNCWNAKNANIPVNYMYQNNLIGEVQRREREEKWRKGEKGATRIYRSKGATTAEHFIGAVIYSLSTSNSVGCPLEDRLASLSKCS